MYDKFRIVDGVRYELVKNMRNTFLLEREGKLYTWHKTNRELNCVGYVEGCKSNQSYGKGWKK